jgi:hypothetical protein
VINEAAFPVMVVPENISYSPLSKILLATDLRFHDVKCFSLVGQLARAHQVLVQLILILDRTLQVNITGENLAA